MNTNKRGRPKLPDGMKSVTTSIRLRPDRLEMYKRMGGVNWLNQYLDNILEMEKVNAAVYTFNAIRQL